MKRTKKAVERLTKLGEKMKKEKNIKNAIEIMEKVPVWFSGKYKSKLEGNKLYINKDKSRYAGFITTDIHDEEFKNHKYSLIYKGWAVVTYYGGRETMIGAVDIIEDGYEKARMENVLV